MSYIMTPSQKCYDLIKQFEGCKLTAYKDSVGVWTIGYGSTINVCAGMTITQQQADDRLISDVHQAAVCVDGKVSVIITQNQFDALTSFVFNLGCAAFYTSTLRRLINLQQFNLAAEEFIKWDHANGQVLPGLLRRRQAEQALFIS